MALTNGRRKAIEGQLSLANRALGSYISRLLPRCRVNAAIVFLAKARGKDAGASVFKDLRACEIALSLPRYLARRDAADRATFSCCNVFEDLR